MSEKEEVIQAVKEILSDMELPLEKQDMESDQNAKTCALGINFFYCNRWDLCVGCLECEHYLGKKENEV